MNDFLAKLLGLKKLGIGESGVVFEFAHSIPAWAWIFIIAACATFAAWSYWKLLGNRAARTSLSIARTLALLLIAAMIAGPQLVKQNERTERDWVVVMADRSASMSITDAGDPTSRTTREKQLEAALTLAQPAFQTLAKDRNLLFLGFDSGSFDLKSEDGRITLGPANGRRTAIGRSLDQSLRRVAARPVAGIVLLSDGRSSDAPGRGILRQLDARQIPVFTVALGSDKPLVDLAVGRVDAPGAAFVNDIIPITADIERHGGSTDSTIRGRVELVDTATNTVLDTRPLTPASGDGSERITFTARPTDAGAAAWAIRVIPETPDLSPDNNSADVHIELLSPIRVVYFDGYPRWEYRYLKNLLMREKSIKSSAMLLASDKRYIQDGSEPLDVIPRTTAGWAPFDVVVMGDLRPDLFSAEQLNQVKDLIANRGGGLLWIGGPGATPAAWRGSPLADLLPFTIGNPNSAEGAAIGPKPWLQPIIMKPGKSAARLGVLRLGENPEELWPNALSDPTLGWTQLRWAQRIDPTTLKPTAEVLALAVAANGQDDSAAGLPLVVTMRYGAGRVVYVGTDEIWRYRYGKGEELPERFWIPILRLLARESLGRTGKPAMLEVTPEQAQIDQSVQVTVRLLDESLVARHPATITVRLISTGDNSHPIELELKPESPSDAAISSVSVFTANWVASEPGQYRVESQDPVLSGLDLSARLFVSLPDDELRTPQTDHALLASLSEATGGQVLTAARLAELPTLLPNRQLRVLGTPEVETLWDKPIVWIVLMVLLCAEWVGRRVIKLP